MAKVWFVQSDWEMYFTNLSKKKKTIENVRFLLASAFLYNENAIFVPTFDDDYIMIETSFFNSVLIFL